MISTFRPMPLLFLMFILSACSTQPPKPTSVVTPESNVSVVSPKASPARKSAGGGYYLDDGPDEHIPHDLAAIPDAVPKAEPVSRAASKPYTVLGKTYKPLAANVGYKVRGIASWYGRKFHGKKTSTGERYDMYAMTAAHPTLPIPSYARVTNLANGQSVVVRINDRGPFLHNRLIDLSYVAAWKLGYIDKGSTEVEVESVHAGDTTLAASAKKDVIAAVSPDAKEITAHYRAEGMASWYGGKFHGRKTANGEIFDKHAMTAAHRTLKLGTVVRVTNPENARFVDVRINDRGPYAKKRLIDLSEAAARRLDFISKGHTKVKIISLDKIVLPVNLPYEVATSDNSAVDDVLADFIADLDDAERQDLALINAKAPGYYVQLASFSNHENAESLRQRLEADFVHGGAQLVLHKSEQFYRVQWGPFTLETAARAAAREISEQFDFQPIVTHR